MDYTTRVARWLLGVSAHPGGLALSRDLLERMALGEHPTVCDVACGAGATARELADRGARVLAVDLDPRGPAGLRRRGIGVAVADAAALPLGDGSCDAVVCECSVSTFADPRAALEQMARVLRAGGSLGLSDVTCGAGGAREGLHRWPALACYVSQLTTPRPLDALAAEVAATGLSVHAVVDRPDAARAVLRRLRRRLGLLPAARALLADADQAVEAGSLGYGLVVARKGPVVGG